ncbi:DUF4956 domain-containing protein [Candidatus Pelagibacter sp.]|nr:DUF4956 domain-containing protein [Candidatus Pelagibacter sp.]
MVFEIIQNCIFSILSGLLIYFTLIATKQNWANTIFYLITFLLLPPVAFVITNIISNNLALSLGMIGALSIVRFRNPVKNPLELVIYFSLITVGISYGVNAKWGFLLTIIVISILAITRFFYLFVKKKNLFDLFKYSFATNDGVLKNLVEVESDIKIDQLESHENLLYFSSDNKNKFVYKLSIEDKSDVEKLKKEVEKIKGVTNIEVRYGN